MIRIDDSLLEELGLLALPKAERDALLRQIYETLEMRVGMKLAERMSEQQLDEFEKFIDGEMVFVENYLNTQKPGWQQSTEYQNAVTAAQDVATKQNRPFNENAVKAEFGALSWLETNFPDYKQVVADELEKLKAEIKKDSTQIAQAVQQQAAGSPPPAAPAPQQDNVVPGNFGQPPQAPPPSQNPYDQNQQPPQAA